jgi:RHS repeat-associated protein
MTTKSTCGVSIQHCRDLLHLVQSRILGNKLGLSIRESDNWVSTYSYDANGNMISDGNRNATLTYNYLNLPKTVTIGGKTLTYDYDAAGNKHKYAADTLTLKYAGAFEYRQVGAVNSLYRVGLSEGQAVFRKNALQFEYSLKDHLGNVRVVFDEKGQVLQKTDYYPFGLSINRDGALPKVQNWVNKYLYNEKELQAGSGYLDFGARMYMPEVGRMSTVDRFAAKYGDVSAYQFGLNNPISNIDINGDSAWKITNEWNSTFIKKFADDLPAYIQKYTARKDKFTCDNLGLSVIMDFSKDNQLPFQWETESKSFDAASSEYSDYNTFSHDVKATSGAPDFQNKENTVGVNASDADRGSILLNAKASNGRAHHVQMIMGKSNDGSTLLIKQGNFTSFLPAQRIWGTGDPSSMRYLGTSIQTGTYNRQTDTWRNITKTTIVLISLSKNV